MLESQEKPKLRHPSMMSEPETFTQMRRIQAPTSNRREPTSTNRTERQLLTSIESHTRNALVNDDISSRESISGPAFDDKQVD